MSIFDGQQVAVAFCSPHRKVRLPNGQWVLDTVSVEWHRRRMALAVGTNINFVDFFADGMEVGEARTAVAYRCLEHQPQPRYLLFLDDDTLPEWDAFIKLFFRLQTRPDYDIAAGVYSCKGIGDPLIYAGDGCGPFWDWTLGDILTSESHGITGTHMGLTLIRVSLFQRLLDTGLVNEETPFFRTVRETGRINGAMATRSGTEDLWFYKLCQKLDPKPRILVDTSVLAGHYDKQTGITWGLPADSPPVQRAKWLKAGNSSSNGHAEPEKIALDIGYGGHKREFPGYTVYTTDIRPECQPDYCQDTLWLNLPNDHFDLVASSHHLEHIGRWNQERVFQEMFRITKPGGRWEHIVPSMEWAAEKIVQGQVDEHTYNVVLGAQEQHGYAREYNTHYMFYTAEILKALAEQAGMINVEVIDWRQKPELGYNLIVRGRKPGPAEKPLLDEPGAMSNSSRLEGQKLADEAIRAMSVYEKAEETIGV